MLAEDRPLPDSLGLAFAVATDDGMVFSGSGAGNALALTKSFEAALVRSGAVGNPDKDVDDVLDATSVGVDLVDGRY